MEAETVNDLLSGAIYLLGMGGGGWSRYHYSFFVVYIKVSIGRYSMFDASYRLPYLPLETSTSEGGVNLRDDM